jgi:hypothetical protein
LAKLGDDDRPTEHGQEEQNADGHFAFGRRLFKRELQRAAGKKWLNQDGHKFVFNFLVLNF